MLQKARFMYKVSAGTAPVYITDLFEQDYIVNSRLRYSSSRNYKIPRPKLELFRGAMSYSGPAIWNTIPESIRCSNTIETFTSNFIRWQTSNRE